jgi:predicted PolB exonuclease-like 3'-5' exonuclease
MKPFSKSRSVFPINLSKRLQTVISCSFEPLSKYLKIFANDLSDKSKSCILKFLVFSSIENSEQALSCFDKEIFRLEIIFHKIQSNRTRILLNFHIQMISMIFLVTLSDLFNNFVVFFRQFNFFPICFIFAKLARNSLHRITRTVTAKKLEVHVVHRKTIEWL